MTLSRANNAKRLVSRVMEPTKTCQTCFPSSWLRIFPQQCPFPHSLSLSLFSFSLSLYIYPFIYIYIYIYIYHSNVHSLYYSQMSLSFWFGSIDCWLKTTVSRCRVPMYTTTFCIFVWDSRSKNGRLHEKHTTQGVLLASGVFKCILI